MINIYDEVGHIKDVLKNGFSDRWKEDAKLLVKYYRDSGMKKSEVLENIKKKCERYILNYNKYTDYRTVNKLVDAAWKDKSPLREIKQVEITKEVLNWFLSLEKNKVTNDDIENIKTKKSNTHVNTKFWNFNKAKCLFTLYIWALIQKNYLEYYKMMHLEKFAKQFKQAANLPSNFNLLKECDNFYDLGYIYINSYRNIDLRFMDLDVFSIPITEENKIIISGEDLYNCGYWLEKQKMGYFICKRCGKEVAYWSKSLGKNRKYCKECADIIINNHTEKISINCVDCGKPIVILRKNYKTCRCKECQEKRTAAIQKAYREKKKNSIRQNNNDNKI